MGGLAYTAHWGRPAFGQRKRLISIYANIKEGGEKRKYGMEERSYVWKRKVRS